jgi:hypothetical protein
MGNLGFQIKRFLSNKNTVTVLGAILIVGIIWFFYNYRIQQAINPQRMPYSSSNCFREVALHKTCQRLDIHSQ